MHDPEDLRWRRLARAYPRAMQACSDVSIAFGRNRGLCLGSKGMTTPLFIRRSAPLRSKPQSKEDGRYMRMSAGIHMYRVFNQASMQPCVGVRMRDEW